LDKVETNWGLSPFRKEGFYDFVAPRVSFIKRLGDHAEVIEYVWQPLRIYDMPDHERIDRLQFTYNRYQYAGAARRFFYGAGVGGNVILYNRNLKDWAAARGIALRDGVTGLGRVFAGYVLRQVRFLKYRYPLVFRVEAVITPDVKFGGELGRAGHRLETSEIRAGLSFSVE